VAILPHKPGSETDTEDDVLRQLSGVTGCIVQRLTWRLPVGVVRVRIAPSPGRSNGAPIDLISCLVTDELTQACCCFRFELCPGRVPSKDKNLKLKWAKRQPSKAGPHIRQLSNRFVLASVIHRLVIRCRPLAVLHSVQAKTLSLLDAYRKSIRRNSD
jgi:hypothetical protein